MCFFGTKMHINYISIKLKDKQYKLLSIQAELHLTLIQNETKIPYTVN
jgi:hypothetical protein